ncbi:hypothetical protein FRB90_011882 [Tulasnella sp. 427]|nr:hypothetical protein FRB90_011882 [Tulasnella sp. 427]
MRTLASPTLFLFLSLIFSVILAVPVPADSDSDSPDAKPSESSVESLIKGMRFPFQYHSHAKPSSSSSKRSLIPLSMQHPSSSINRAPLVVKPGASLGMAVGLGKDWRHRRPHHHDNNHDQNHGEEDGRPPADRAGMAWRHKADTEVTQTNGESRSPETTEPLVSERSETSPDATISDVVTPA